MKIELRKIAWSLGLAILGGMAGTLLINHWIGQPVLNASSTPFHQPVQLVSLPADSGGSLVDFTKAAEMTVHGVVHVRTTYLLNNYDNSLMYDPFRDFLWGNRNPGQQKREASGSGVIISEDGYIVTNNHVVDNADNIEVVLNDKRSYQAKLIGHDPSTDLALLKIDEKGLPFIVFGNSDNLKIGEWVLAVGNPFNLTSTVTAGIVSAKARNINILSNPNNPSAIESFIQTDAAVNPGNSGGALVNTRGELVGINSAIASNTGSYTGYSFAVPVNIVKKVTEDLLEYGQVQRGFIGISIQDVDAGLAKDKGLKEVKGVYIASVVEGGSADEAGIKAGDVVMKIGDVSVNTAPELQEQVGRFRPGDKLNVTVLRNGATQQISVLLKNQDGKTALVKKENQSVVTLAGAEFTELTQQEKNNLRIDHGVKVSKLNGGKLRSVGIREGFIITSIDNKAIKDVKELESVLNSKKGGILIEGIYPNGLKAYYGFGM